MRFPLWTALVWIGMPLCAAGPSTVEPAAQRLEEICSKVPAPLGSQFRFLAARGLKARHPDPLCLSASVVFMLLPIS